MTTPPRAIERSFPIVQVNPLSVRERNAFKPVYKMHKWFARRSSSIFRAILLGAALPAERDGVPLDLMAEFYKGHGDDLRLRRADGRPLRVLDPFMGGGTTVVEALRLGFEVIGVDYNPVAWFIVRGETTPVDLKALDAAYRRLAAKVQDELLSLYRTRCPLTGGEADIIYGFWVKQGVCVDPACGAVTDLFKSYVVGQIQGDLGLYYLPDVRCPSCEAVFDWELERCTITAGGPQVIGAKAAGKTRPEGTRWAYGRLSEGVHCPCCASLVKSTSLSAKIKRTKKKLLVQVLLDPTTGDFFEVRGELPETVTAPVSGHSFQPMDGPVVAPGKFVCAHCGRRQAIVESADKLGKPLSFRYYGFYAFTPHGEKDLEQAERLGLPTNNHKWFAAASAEDIQRVNAATAELALARASLPIPEQEIPEGRNFRDLLRQGYKRWSDLYGPRQLLALGKLLKAIDEEPNPTLRDAMLGAFQSMLDSQSNLTGYHAVRNMQRGVQAAHDYRNPTTSLEVNTWGLGGGLGSGAFSNCMEKISEGLLYRDNPDVFNVDSYVSVPDNIPRRWNATLHNASSTNLPLADRSIDLVITDPPYAGSVQYAEMSDWSYVWLHQVLKRHHPEQFGAEITLKSQEIIEDNGAKDAAFFFDQLTEAWRECHRVLVDDGLLVFTFHHREGDRWTGLLRSLFNAGFYLVAAYPTHSEALNSIVIQATQGITYDIIHVCRKRTGAVESIPWSRLRRQVTQEAQAQLKEIEAGGDVLPGPDVQMILLGRALRLFSQHYGRVLNAENGVMDLDEAMERILLLVREVRGEELPLPGALQDIDSLSQLVLLHIAGRGPWKRDDLHKELRGYLHGPDVLLDAGLVREQPGKKGWLEAVPAVERGGLIRAVDPAALIDRAHVLLAEVNAGHRVDRHLLRWRGRWEKLKELLSWLGRQDPTIKDLAGLAHRQIEAMGPDVEVTSAAEQLGLFGKER